MTHRASESSSFWRVPADGVLHPERYRAKYGDKHVLCVNEGSPKQITVPRIADGLWPAAFNMRNYGATLTLVNGSGESWNGTESDEFDLPTQHDVQLNFPTRDNSENDFRNLKAIDSLTANVEVTYFDLLPRVLWHSNSHDLSLIHI